MQKNCPLIGLALCLAAGACFAQSASRPSGQQSLCSLQKKIAAGTQESVLVSGIFNDGLDSGTLEDTGCPKESTWVELALYSKQNREKLRKLLEQSHKAYVVFEGEFYGPPLPDAKLPAEVRKHYHPGWGHLGAFRTKLVVRVIRNVKAARTSQTNGYAQREK